MSPKGEPIPRRTGRLTVGRKINSTQLNYRPVLSSERVLYRKKKQAIVTKERIRIKSGHGPQKGARYQDKAVN
jgi:hypothetical protein